MNCAELEILYCDYLDGTLAAEARTQVENHLAQCAACAQMARDIQAAVGFMERVEDVQPPHELLTRILSELPLERQARARQSGGLRRLLNGWVRPTLQPRFAMGIAMTMLSFSLLGRYVGFRPQDVSWKDVRPGVVWQRLEDQVDRGWGRISKFYQNLRLVYEIETQLRDWTQKEQEVRGRSSAEDQQANPPGRTQPSRGAGSPQGSAARTPSRVNGGELKK